jgi:uncharacterized protein (TIGR02996 family)
MTDAPTSEETAFVRAVHAQPLDPLPRLIFADWLDEHGRDAEAAWLRADARAAQAHPDPDPADVAVVQAGSGPEGVPSLWLCKAVWDVSWAAATLFLSVGQSLHAALRGLTGRVGSGVGRDGRLTQELAGQPD